MISSIVPHLLVHCEEALLSAEGFLAAAKDSVARMVAPDGKVSRSALDRHQRAAHALPWFATNVEALRPMARGAGRLEHEKLFGEIEKLILQAAFGEYLVQLVGGIPMSQNEIARSYDMGLDDSSSGEFWTETVRELVALGTASGTREAIADYLAAHAGAMTIGNPGLDETMDMVREQFFRFAQGKG